MHDQTRGHRVTRTNMRPVLHKMPTSCTHTLGTKPKPSEKPEANARYISRYDSRVEINAETDIQAKQLTPTAA